MSSTEEIEKVTTDRPKNSGRQEWGRKLGKMQKELKAKKLAEVPQQQTQTRSFLKWEYGIAFVSLLVGLGAFYYQKKSYDKSQDAPLAKTIPHSENKNARFSDF
jgi:hypothetical protein